MMDNNKGFSENRFLFILMAILFVILGPLFFLKFSNIKVAGLTLNMPDAAASVPASGDPAAGGGNPSDPAAGPSGTLAAAQIDGLLVTALKTLAVLVLVLAALVFSLLTGLADLFFLAAGHRFPLTTAMWGFIWQTVMIGWFWEHASTVGTLLGAAIFAGLAVLGYRLAALIKDQEGDAQQAH